MDVAYVGAKGTDCAALDVNADDARHRQPGRPFFSLGRTVRVDSWGARLKTMYQSMQVF